MRKKIFLAIAFIFSLLFISTKAFALDGIEIFSGFLKANLEEKRDNYIGIPVCLALNFDIKKPSTSSGILSKGRVNFVVEPFITTIFSPDTNIEVGTNLLLKYTYPLSKRVKTYIKGGAGVLYMSQHTREQSTQYNFLPQAGLGFHFFLNEKTAISCEYRYRHLSNASVKHPNSGIDADIALGGVSFFF
jgi:hypothetical protein